MILMSYQVMTCETVGAAITAAGCHVGKHKSTQPVPLRSAQGRVGALHQSRVGGGSAWSSQAQASDGQTRQFCLKWPTAKAGALPQERRESGDLFPAGEGRRALFPRRKELDSPGLLLPPQLPQNQWWFSNRLASRS